MFYACVLRFDGMDEKILVETKQGQSIGRTIVAIDVESLPKWWSSPSVFS